MAVAEGFCYNGWPSKRLRPTEQSCNNGQSDGSIEREVTMPKGTVSYLLSLDKIDRFARRRRSRPRAPRACAVFGAALSRYEELRAKRGKLSTRPIGTGRPVPQGNGAGARRGRRFQSAARGGVFT